MQIKLSVLLSVAILAMGCGRKTLPVKKTPAQTKIYVAFTADPSFVEIMKTHAMDNARRSAPHSKEAQALALFGADARSVAGVDALSGAKGDSPAVIRAGAQAEADAKAIGGRLNGQMRADLVQKNLGFPVLELTQGHDLALTGTVRRSNTGVELSWQLTDPRSKTTVNAGVKTDHFFTGNVEDFSDAVLEKLLAMDIDAFASGGVPMVAQHTPGKSKTLLPAPHSETSGANAYAVIVGIDTYREKLPKASHAEADAKAFAAYAKDTLGVPEAHIKVLLGQRAGRGDLSSMIEEWLPRNANRAGGTVYFFFSGHGAPDPESGDAYLVPWDADPAYIKTRGVRVSDLYASLEKLPGQQVFAFLDACFTGSGDRSVIAEGTRPLVPVKAPTAKGVIALTASAARETTGAARDANHGLFTRHLLAGLGGGADVDNDRVVTLAELADYVTQKVSADARLDNRDQTPSLIAPSGVNPASIQMVVGLKSSK